MRISDWSSDVCSSDLGLIQIITNKPTADFSGGASLQYGSFGQIILEGHQNLPISKTIRTRTAFIYNRDDGFQKNRYTGTRFGKTKVWGIREKIGRASCRERVCQEV